MNETINEKVIKDYLISLGISKYNYGFYYLTCSLKTYVKLNNPLISIREIYTSVEEENHLGCSYNIFYHRCNYALKSANQPDVRAKSVKKFFYDAYESIRSNLVKNQKEE